MNHKLRLHHFKNWYNELYFFDEDLRQLFAKDLNEEEGDEREYSRFCLEDIPETLFSFSPQDMITVVQNKDVICSKCPKPQNENCYRFDPHNELTRTLGLKVGEAYSVEYILRLFGVYNHQEERQTYSLNEMINLYVHMDDLIRATFLGLHDDVESNMEDLQCIGEGLGLTLSGEDEESQKEILDKIVTYVEGPLHKRALEIQHPRVKEKLKSIWTETRPLVVRNLAQSLLEGDYGLWQAPTRGKDQRMDLACYLSGRGFDLVHTILTCENLNGLLEDKDLTSALASAHQKYSELITAVDERLDYRG